jgi:3-oxocholest-4-en-26-oyl-CoA dehydrogenase alpha subunit
VRLSPTTLTAEELVLQQEVREFLAAELPRGSFEPGLGMTGANDPAFSRKLGERGWLGMALPKEFGGGDRTAVDRFVVVEELLRWGAPVHHHWVADRRSGPVINRFGTLEQKEFFLPRICSGELQFAIGMSEPDAGSDLAGLRTRATKVDGGWRVSGTKIWTTAAHTGHYLLLLCRTSDEPDRHAGLSQLLVDLRTDGVSANPITFIDGSAEFNEVVLDDVFVPDDRVLGVVGEGWKQVTSELSYERSGPDRWLSTFLVAEYFMREAEDVADPEQLRALGRATARWWGIRLMSLAVARMIDEGHAPAVESSMVKEMGTRFEQDVLAELLDVVRCSPDLGSASQLERLLARAVLTAPSFTIRGGTNEVLVGVVAKGLTR